MIVSADVVVDGVKQRAQDMFCILDMAIESIDNNLVVPEVPSSTARPINPIDQHSSYLDKSYDLSQKPPRGESSSPIPVRGGGKP
jgi:hypothetical protein